MQLPCGGQACPESPAQCCQEVGPGEMGRLCGWSPMNRITLLVRAPGGPLPVSVSFSLCLCFCVSYLGARASRIYSELPGPQTCPWQWNQSLRKPPHQNPCLHAAVPGSSHDSPPFRRSCPSS